MLVKCLSLMVQGSFAMLNQTSTEQLQTLFGLLLLLLFGFGVFCLIVFFPLPQCFKESSKCLLPLAS